VTPRYLLLFAAGLPVPVLALDGCRLGAMAGVSAPAVEPDGAPGAVVVVARDPNGRTQATPMLSLSVGLTRTATDQGAHPDAAEDVACAIH